MNFKLSIRLLNRGQFCSQLKMGQLQTEVSLFICLLAAFLPTIPNPACYAPATALGPPKKHYLFKIIFLLGTCHPFIHLLKATFFVFQLKLSSSVISFYKAFSDSTHSPTAPLSLHTYLTALLESRSYLINYYIHRALLPSNRLQDKLMNEGMNTD